jgi:hypothetical protein
MFTVKCPLHFLGTSGGNIVTHAYWWSVTLSCGTRNISQISLHSEQLCEIVEWPVTVEFPLVSDRRLDDQGSIKLVFCSN